MKRGLLFFLIFISVLALDFVLKGYVHTHIPSIPSPFFPYGGIGIFQIWNGFEFSVIHVINKGAAWGMLAAWQLPLLCARLLVVVGMILYLCLSEKIMRLSPRYDSYVKRYLNLDGSQIRPFFKQVPFVLIISGAIGNILDYFIYGHVVDMFHLRFWSYTYPVFNVADSAIFCGIAFLLLDSFLGKRQEVVSS